MTKRTQKATEELLREHKVFNDYLLLRASGNECCVMEECTTSSAQSWHYGHKVVRPNGIHHTKMIFRTARAEGQDWRAARATSLLAAQESVGGEWEKSPFGGYHPKGTIARVLGE